MQPTYTARHAFLDTIAAKATSETAKKAIAKARNTTTGANVAAAARAYGRHG